ncbi:hypothetical protein T484DRAFT_1800498, partial [Baffinella frigidus]
MASPTTSTSTPKSEEWPSDVKAHMNAILVSRLEQKEIQDGANNPRSASKRRSLEQQLLEMEFKWRADVSKGVGAQTPPSPILAASTPQAGAARRAESPGRTAPAGGVRPRVSRSLAMEEAAARVDPASLHQRLDDLWNSRHTSVASTPRAQSPAKSVASPEAALSRDRSPRMSPVLAAMRDARKSRLVAPYRGLSPARADSPTRRGEGGGAEEMIRLQAKLSFMSERLTFVREQSVNTRQQLEEERARARRLEDALEKRGDADKEVEGGRQRAARAEMQVRQLAKEGAVAAAQLEQDARNAEMDKITAHQERVRQMAKEGAAAVAQLEQDTRNAEMENAELRARLAQAKGRLEEAVAEGRAEARARDEADARVRGAESRVVELKEYLHAAEASRGAGGEERRSLAESLETKAALVRGLQERLEVEKQRAERLETRLETTEEALHAARARPM